MLDFENVCEFESHDGRERREDVIKLVNRGISDVVEIEAGGD
jgi:hypothetical protein